MCNATVCVCACPRCPTAAPLAVHSGRSACTNGLRAWWLHILLCRRLCGGARRRMRRGQHTSPIVAAQRKSCHNQRTVCERLIVARCRREKTRRLQVVRAGVLTPAYPRHCRTRAPSRQLSPLIPKCQVAGLRTPSSRDRDSGRLGEGAGHRRRHIGSTSSGASACAPSCCGEAQARAGALSMLLCCCCRRHLPASRTLAEAAPGSR